jgi:Bax protein
MNTTIKISHKRVKNKILNTFSRFSLSALVVTSFFYTAPIFINFVDKNFNNKEFTNNSKNILNKTLNKGKTFEEDDTWMQSNEIDLLYDILEENNLEINLVRYTTSEINALFKEVRDTKLVKPVDIGLLPNENKNIAKKKKKRNVY